jgi:deoxyribonuclease-2
MTVSALDENGKSVDWWFIYKVPKLTQDAKSDSATGYEYVYFDQHAKKVSKSPNLLNHGKGALNLTLNSLFTKPANSTGWILYNDEMPAAAKGKDSGTCGHTKGVIGFDTASETAFWLLHSWPKYAAPGAAAMPTPQYGQTFLCLSLDLATANQLATQMENHQQPQCFLPRAATLTKSESLYALTQPLKPNPPGDADVIQCKTKAGMPFKVLAKNREWGKDFWNDWVGPQLKADLDVETWIRGKVPPVVDSDGIHKTFDVKFINLGPLGAHWAWPESHDHAKWGITTSDGWICVGDINRMVSQEKRGGGTIAFQNQTLWQALSRTDLILAPPGHTRDDALRLIKGTHHSHEESDGTKASEPAESKKAKKMPGKAAKA